MSFYDNYLRLCNRNGVSPSRAAVEAGTTKTSVNRWKSGSRPSDATLLKLADYFGCTVAELSCDEETKMPAAENGSGQDEEELMEEIMQTIRSRPEMRMLFDAGKKATPETVRQTARFLEGLAKGENAD